MSCLFGKAYSRGGVFKQGMSKTRRGHLKKKHPGYQNEYHNVIKILFFL